MTMDAISCRLCGAPLPADGPRCANCGLHRATDLDRAGYVRLAIGLTGVYLVTALLVLLVRSGR